MKLRLCYLNGDSEFTNDILELELTGDKDSPEIPRDGKSIEEKIKEIAEKLKETDYESDPEYGGTGWRISCCGDKEDGGYTAHYEHLYEEGVEAKLNPWTVIHKLFDELVSPVGFNRISGKWIVDEHEDYSFDINAMDWESDDAPLIEGSISSNAETPDGYDNHIFKGVFFESTRDLLKNETYDESSGMQNFYDELCGVMKRSGYWLAPKSACGMKDKKWSIENYENNNDLPVIEERYATEYCSLFGRLSTKSKANAECYSCQYDEYKSVKDEERDSLEKRYIKKAEEYRKCFSEVILEDLKHFDKLPKDIPVVYDKTESGILYLAFKSQFGDMDETAEIELSYDVKKEPVRKSYAVSFERWKYVWTWDDEKQEGVYDGCFSLSRASEGGSVTDIIEDNGKMEQSDTDALEECTSIEKLKKSLGVLWTIRNATMQELISQTTQKGSEEELEKAFRNTLQKTKDNEKYIISKELSGYLEEICCDWLPVISEAVNGKKEVSELVSDKYLPNSRELLPIPWLAIMGDAGTGKTTLAKRLAEDCFGASFMQTSPSELVSGYKNFTAHSFAMKVYRAQQKRGVGYPLIVFIDEAYSLFEQSTGNQGADGNKQLVELIINLANTKWGGQYVHDLSELSEKDNLKDEDGNVVDKVIFKHVVIWLGGYEMRLRSSMKTNEGLARRFGEQIVIPTPKRQELYKAFLELYHTRTDPECSTVSALTTDELEKKIGIDEADRNALNDFLVWASSRTRSTYFGNRAGVGKLVDSLIRNEKMSYAFSEALKKAIARCKDNIKRQYSAELRSGFPRLPFEVISEIDLGLDDYIGKQSLKDEFLEVIDMMADPGKYEKKRISMPRGALLMGSPGSGKSFLAKCMAGEVMTRAKKADKDVAFIPISGTDILAQANPIGVIKLLFSEAAKYDAAVIFIDEIDFIGKNRNRSDSHAAILGALMTEMDGFDRKTNIFVLAATNAPYSLDPALMRDGRFDMKFVIDHPDKDTSEKLVRAYFGKYGLNLYTRNAKKPQLSKEQTERAILLLEGLMPAEVESVLKQAVLLYHRTEAGIRKGLYKNNPEPYAHRKNGDDYICCDSYDEDQDSEITNAEGFLRDIKETLDIKYYGRRRREEAQRVFSVEKNDESGSSTAVHEVGHALVSRLLKGDFDDTERITILGRGKALGYVEQKKGLETYTLSDFKIEIMICMGGRVAEEIVYGRDNIGPGASKDIIMATRLAGRMIERWGFSDEVGFMSISVEEDAYLGGKAAYMVSEGLREKVELETQKLLKECILETRALLKNKKELILELAKEVYNQREMTGAQMETEYKRIDREISRKTAKK